MQQWSAEQLSNAAQSAIEKSKYQDAVSVLGYLIQNYPDSIEAERGREQYRFLTGTPYPDMDVFNSEPQETDETTDLSAAPARAEAPLQPANAIERIDDHQNGAASKEQADLSTGEQIAIGPAEKMELNGAETASENITQPKKKLVEDNESDRDLPAQGKEVVSAKDNVSSLTVRNRLQNNDRIGRFLADMFYALGWVMTPVGILLLLFSPAFSSLLLWGPVMLVTGLLSLGLGQTMWAVFDARSKLNLIHKQLEHKSKTSVS